MELASQLLYVYNCRHEIKSSIETNHEVKNLLRFSGSMLNEAHEIV